MTKKRPRLQIKSGAEAPNYPILKNTIAFSLKENDLQNRHEKPRLPSERRRNQQKSSACLFIGQIVADLVQGKRFVALAYDKIGFYPFFIPEIENILSYGTITSQEFDIYQGFEPPAELFQNAGDECFKYDLCQPEF